MHIEKEQTMKISELTKMSIISIGHVGEKNFRDIVFDASDWLVKHPNAHINIMILRYKETVPYPQPLEIIGHNAIWHVNDVDTAINGKGKGQLVLNDNGTVIGKSDVFTIFNGRSLDNAENVPDPYESWFTNLTNLADLISDMKDDVDIKHQRIETLYTSVDNIQKDVENKKHEIDAIINTIADDISTAEDILNDIKTEGTEAIESITDSKNNGLLAINSLKEFAIEEIDNKKGTAITEIQNKENTVLSEAISEINTVKNTSISDVNNTGSENIQNINETGTLYLKQIDNKKGTAITEIQNEKNTVVSEAISEINIVKNTSISDVNSSGSANIQNINETGTSYLTQIAEEMTKLEHYSDEFKADIEEIDSRLSESITEISQLKEDLIENKRIDDARWKMSQGIVWDFAEDTAEAYSKDIPTGARLMDVQMIGGKSVVWNQLIDKEKFRSSATVSGITYTINADGSVTMNGECVSSSFFTLISDQNYIKIPKGHKAYFSGIEKVSVNTCWVQGKTREDETYYLNNGNEIFETIGTDFRCNIRCEAGAVLVNETIRPKLFDLTAMFGAGNEPTDVNDPRIKFIESYASTHPEYNAGQIVSADVTDVVIRGAETETRIPIPSAIRNLDGYGWGVGVAMNEVDYEKKQYVQRVVCVDLGSLNYARNSTNQFYTTVNIPSINRTTNGICSKYLLSATGGYDNPRDKSLTFNGLNGKRLWCIDSSYSSATEIKNGNNGVMLYYEIAEPIVTDISDLLDDCFESIEVEPNCSITFEQANTELAVPNKETYLIALKEVV